jgi:hypothetical protein
MQQDMMAAARRDIRARRCRAPTHLRESREWSTGEDNGDVFDDLIAMTLKGNAA